MQDVLIAFIDPLDLSLKRHQQVARVRAGAERLTLSQLQYLDAIAGLGTPTLSALAQRLNHARASVTIAVNRLVALGYVTKAPSEADGRSIVVKLTPAGLRLTAAKDRALKTYAAELESALTPREARQFRAIMTKIIRRFEQAKA